MEKHPKRKVREVICSKIQDKCFNVIDQEASENTFVRMVQSEASPRVFLTQVYFKKIGDKEVIDKTIVQPSYFKGMIQMAFEFGTFGSLEDFGKGHVLQIGLGGGGINILFEDRFPQTKLTSVDMDSTMKYIAKEWFLVKEDDKQKIIIEDGIKFIKNNNQKFDLIMVDICYNEQSSLICPIAPFLDPSVIKAVSDSLTSSGTLSVNFLYAGKLTMENQENFEMDGNHILGCTHNNIPRITPDYLKYRRNKIDKEVRKIIGGDFKLNLQR
ncbi:hypothetical protein FO519_008018 [Halicephalobus sp. NKZ332]|nr:hypothetical protein FO519_008018 [Halicephalobus sp. NKZ332]